MQLATRKTFYRGISYTECYENHDLISHVKAVGILKEEEK